MPREWYDIHSVLDIKDDTKRDFYKRIVADKKPYFMKYIYPDLSKQYSKYIKNGNRNCLRKFGVEILDLENKVNKTEDEDMFLSYFHRFNPVGIGNCVSNSICWKFEEYFDGFVATASEASPFDYSILKSGTLYTENEYYSILKLQKEYNSRLQSYSIFSDYERIDDESLSNELTSIKNNFKSDCEKVCPNKFALCDILLDISYRKNATKKFVWDMCSDVIIENLLKNNGMTLSLPIKDDCGDIEYCGNKFSIVNVLLEECE